MIPVRVYQYYIGRGDIHIASQRIWIMITRDLRSMLEFFYAGMPFVADITGLENSKNGRL